MPGTAANLDGAEARVPFVQARHRATSTIVENVLRRARRSTSVVNFAAESHNSLAILDPGRFFRTNALGTQALLRGGPAGRGRAASTTCRRARSTATSPLDVGRAFTEESPYRPRTPYNASKAAADHTVRAYYETFELPITITNCSNNYGPYQFPEKVIPLFVTNALDDEPLPLYASTENRREWLHVATTAARSTLVLARAWSARRTTSAAGVEASIEEIADLVLELPGSRESLKTIVPDRPGHDRRYLLDCSKIGRELGWEPQVGFDDGVRDTVEWYAANRDWWEPLRERLLVEETAWTK